MRLIKELEVNSETIVFLDRLWENLYTGDYLSGVLATQILIKLFNRLSYVDEEVLTLEVCGERTN